MPRKRKSSSKKPGIRDRIVELRRVKASELREHPRNWRTHGEAQSERLAAMLREIGYADALLAYEGEDGALILFDGHLRRDLTPDKIVPVLVTDLSAAEAETMLATLDPIGAMAGTDDQSLEELLGSVTTEDPSIQSLLDELATGGDVPAAESVEAIEGETQTETAEPPAGNVSSLVSWILIGIPMARFGEIAGDLERIQSLGGVQVDTTVTEGLDRKPRLIPPAKKRH